MDKRIDKKRFKRWVVIKNDLFVVNLSMILFMIKNINLRNN